MMKTRLAFAGFRHDHVLEMYEYANERDDVEVVAACEENAPAREKLESVGQVKITHTSYDQMYQEVDFDALAVGDYYGRRGEIIIRALTAGKHVISDEPVCTKPDELDRITELASEKKLTVGCMLTMRDEGNFLALREVVRSGRIGEVHTIDFNCQHKLVRNVRPEWYFQPDKQGGTINDLAPHAIDIIPWLTGRQIVAVVAARAWNARVSDPDWFQDGAQVMFRLDNDGGVIGDLSYLTPDDLTCHVPCDWRLTLTGIDGIAETSGNADGVMLYCPGADSPERVPPAPPRPGGYLEDFLNEIRGRKENGAITTADVLTASRVALLAQRAADENICGLPCE